MKWFRVVIIGMAMISITTVAQAENIVTNCGFETPDAGDFFSNYGYGTTFGNWTVADGSIDLVGTFWQAAEGNQSVDMSGNAPGSIYQDLATVSGQEYTLSFALSGNPTPGPAIMQMEVFWDGDSLGVVTFNTTGHTYSDMGWTTKSFEVTASDALTRLQFTSLMEGNAGPVLDNVVVAPVPEPSALALLAAGLFALAACKRRKVFQGIGYSRDAH